MKGRLPLFIASSVLLIAVIVLAFAGVPWSSPLAPAQRHALDPANFQIVMGSALHTEAGLQVGAVGTERVALQALPLGPQGIAADDFKVLRYRFDDFPRTLELSLLFRRASDPDDVQVVSLPWPESGDSAFNLRDVPGWRGQIIELGFIESATPQLIPSGVTFPPFRLVDAALWSPSWQGGLAALSTDWLAYRPWGLFSVSSVDQEAGLSLPRRPALVLAVEITIVAVGVSGLLLLGWRRRAFRVGVLVAFGVGWLLLDSVWVAQLYERQATTRQLYSGKTWPERSRLVPDTDLLKAADQIRDIVAALDPVPRVVIHASSPFEMTRLQYLSLPINAGLLVHVIHPMRYSFPPGTLLVLYGMQDWTYDADTRQVKTPDLRFASVPVFEDGALRIFRIIAPEQP